MVAVVAGILEAQGGQVELPGLDQVIEVGGEAW